MKILSIFLKLKEKRRGSGGAHNGDGDMDCDVTKTVVGGVSNMAAGGCWDNDDCGFAAENVLVILS